MECVSYALVVRDACKKYGRGKNANVVLNRTSLEVKSGQIYALLGASGCGKTTLLTCVLGIRKLDSGQIRILGQPPDGVRVVGGRVGYMPQEVSLYMEFSAREMMAFFGRLHGMGRQDVRDRMDFLSRFLKLPDLDLPIHALSGGQQRRVSFAVSLFRQPELLILDEPTVGVDAILRQAIWNYLRELASSGKMTVILTTHYVEEASKADLVGFMQDGRFLAQDTPRNLLKKHGATRLEDAFLSLCLNQNQAYPNQQFGHLEEPENDILALETNSTKDPTGTFVNHVGAILYRNMLCVLHYIVIWSVSVVSPVVLMVLFCIVLGGSLKDLKLGVVNREWPTDPICVPFDDCLMVNLSCLFLAHLDHDLVHLVAFEDEVSAMGAVQSGQTVGYLSFQSNYSDSFVDRIWDIFANVDNGTLDNSVATLRMDMTDLPLAVTLQRMVLLRFARFTSDLLSMCGYIPDILNIPVKFGESLVGPEDPTYQHAGLPGILSMMIFAYPMMTVFFFVIMERNDGMLTRTWVSGVTDWGLLTGLLLTQMVFLVVQFAPVISLMYWHLEMGSSLDSLPWFLLLALLEGINSIATGVLLSMLLPTIATAGFLSLVFGFILWFMSGTIWHLETLASDTLLRFICEYSPVAIYAEGFRDTFIRGRAMGHPAVRRAFAYGTLWTAASSLAAIVGFKKLKFRFIK